MKVLIISHTVFSFTESMGKTLASYFSAFSAEELAQFYIHSQIPTTSVCSEYYRFTDIDAIKSILWKKRGCSFNGRMNSASHDGRIDGGAVAKLYQKGRKKSAFIYILRNIWWKISRWNNKEFREWIDTVNPDCVFFASGDYAFMYDIALKISQEKKIPLFISCMDDYYFNTSKDDSFLDKLYHHFFMNSVCKTMKYASIVFCICEKMSNDYAKFFKKRCITIHTPSLISEPLHYPKQSKICYLGSLGHNRSTQLLEIGKALKTLNLSPNHLDVYSSESRPEILKEMTEDNGIVFHNAVGAEKVLEIMGESIAVVHTESFEYEDRIAVRYSVSTKIADSLASGTCIFAYGPKDVASIEYLQKGEAAFCCFHQEDLCDTLRSLIEDEEKRNWIIGNALTLAHNHSASKTPCIIRNTIMNENNHDKE